MRAGAQNIRSVHASRLLGKMALAFGLIGLLAVFLSGVLPAQVVLPLAALGPVAIVVGIVSYLQSANRAAGWAIAAGVFVSMYLPTLWVGYVIFA